MMVLTRLVTSIIWWYFVQNANEYRFLGLLNAQEQGLGICIFIRTSQRLEATGLGDTLEKNVTVNQSTPSKGPPLPPGGLRSSGPQGWQTGPHPGLHLPLPLREGSPHRRVSGPQADRRPPSSLLSAPTPQRTSTAHC